MAELGFADADFRGLRLEAFHDGAVVMVKLKDFMIHKSATMRPGPNLNLVIGPNGSGKSSFISALCLGLGGKPGDMERATKLRGFVRNSATSGEILVALRAKDETKGYRTVHRRIFSARDASEWWLDGVSAKPAEVTDLMLRLNIRMDNLCQFLPQERISRFAKMSPAELLRETEQVFPGERLYETHSEIIEAQTMQGDAESQRETLTQAIAEKQEKLRRMEAPLASAQERRRRQELLAQKEKYILAVQAHELSAKLTDAKQLRTELRAKRDQYRETAAAAAKDLRAHTDFHRGTTDAVKAAGDALAAAKARRTHTLQTATRAFKAYSSAHAAIHGMDVEREGMQRRLTLLEGQLEQNEARLAGMPDMDSLKATRREARQKLEDASKEAAKLHSRSSEAQHKLNAAVAAQTEAEATVEQVEHASKAARNTIARSFRSRSRATAMLAFAAAIEKGRAHGWFQGKVLLPACLEFPVWGQEADVFGAMLDTQLSQDDRMAITCEHPDDKALITGWRFFVGRDKPSAVGTIDAGPGSPLFPQEQSGGAAAAASAGGAGRGRFAGYTPVGLTVNHVSAKGDALYSRLSDEESTVLLADPRAPAAQEIRTRAMKAGTDPIRVTADLKARLAEVCKLRDGSPVFVGSMYDELSRRGCDPLLLKALVMFNSVTDVLLAFDAPAAEAALKRPDIVKMLPVGCRVITPTTVMSLLLGKATKRVSQSVSASIGVGARESRLCFPRPAPSDLADAVRAADVCRTARAEAAEASREVYGLMSEARRAKDAAEKVADEARSNLAARSSLERGRNRHLLSVEQLKAKMAEDATEEAARLFKEAIQCAARLAAATASHSKAAKDVTPLARNYLAECAPLLATSDTREKLEAAAAAAAAEVETVETSVVAAEQRTHELSKLTSDKKREFNEAAGDPDARKALVVKLSAMDSLPKDSVGLQMHIDTEKAALSMERSLGSAERLLVSFDEAKEQVRALTQELEALKSGLSGRDRELADNSEAFSRQMLAKVEVIDAAFSESLHRMRCAGKVEFSQPEGSARHWGIVVKVAYRQGEELTPLTGKRHSGGERATATMMYLLALQATATVPFRVVDEVNQGMDAANERSVFQELQRQCRPAGTAATGAAAPSSSSSSSSSSSAASSAAAAASAAGPLGSALSVGSLDPATVAAASRTPRYGCQYFILTPKLLSNLVYEPHCRVHTVFNGAHVHLPGSAVSLRDIVAAKLGGGVASSGAAGAEAGGQPPIRASGRPSRRSRAAEQESKHAEEALFDSGGDDDDDDNIGGDDDDDDDDADMAAGSQRKKVTAAAGRRKRAAAKDAKPSCAVDTGVGSKRPRAPGLPKRAEARQREEEGGGGEYAAGPSDLEAADRGRADAMMVSPDSEASSSETSTMADAAAADRMADAADFDVSSAIRMVRGIEVSANDERDYAFEKLPNGMRIVVVSDPSAEQAAASAAVQVGSLADYRDLAGTAHALEHLCFMGSDKFPGEEEWASWLADNGGMSNAYTASTQTNYHYQVRATSLRASLERWSRFFVAPLLHEGAWSRELKNIDSEHSKNISNDMWRQMQLDRSTSDPEHAVCAFATGNKATLHDDPVAAGVDVRAKLLEFHRRHYTSSRMTVALLGKEDVDTLMAWAREFFADVRDEGDAQPVYGSDPYKGRTGLVQTMVPLKETRTITMLWTIPPQQSHFLSRPSGLASHLLGHEGPGSVLEALKARGWATELSAGNFADEADFATFVVEIRLTPEGLAHTDDVVACVFEYIRIMQEEGAEKQKWVFEEVAAVDASSFRFKGRSNPLSYVTGLSSGLTYLPGRFAVSRGSLTRVWDPAAYAAVLACFTPERVRVRIAAQDAAVKDLCDKAEPVYGTQYGERPASAEQLALWKGEGGAGRTFPDLALPEPNPFLATDFALRSGVEPGRTVDTRLRAEKEAEPAADLGTADSILLEAARGQPACGRRVMPAPTLLDDSTEGALFWRCDDWFGEPKTVVQVQYKQPNASASAEQSLLTSLLGLTLTDDLGSMSYAASVAGLHYGIGDTTSGLTLAVSGFSHKAGVLLARVTDAFAAAAAGAAAAADSPALSEQAVARQSRKRTETYVNNDLSPLYHLAMIEAGYACSDGQYHYKSKLDILRAWQAADGEDHPKLMRARLLDHARTLFSTCAARILVFGNATEAEARALADAVRSPMRVAKAVPPSPADLALPAMTTRGILPPAGTNARVVIPCRNPNDNNGAINVRLILGPDTVATSALTAVIGGLAAQPAFTQLRTKEALGYIVFAGSFRGAGSVGLRVIVQSATMTARQLEDRCESFLWGFRATLASMTEERFIENRDAAVAKRREALSSLASAAGKVWFEISDGTMRFSRAAEEVRAISKLTLDQVREAFDRAFAPGAPMRRRVSIIMTEGEGAPDAAAASAEGAAGAAAGAGEDDAADAGTETPPPAPECTTLTGLAAVEHFTAAAEADITGWPSAPALELLPADATVPAPPAIVVAEMSPALLKAACGRVPAAGQATFAAWRAEQAAGKA